MQVTDLLHSLGEQFPRHKDVLKARAGTYRMALEQLAGDRLTSAYERTMGAWSKESPPWPKDILDSAPEAVSGWAVRLDQTERAQEIQRKLILDTLHFLAFEIAAAAKDHGIEQRELEGSLDWRWRKTAWELACNHVKFGTAVPQRMPVAHGEIETLARGIKQAAGVTKRAGTFKPLRPPAIELDQAPEAERESRAAAFEAAEG